MNRIRIILRYGHIGEKLKATPYIASHNILSLFPGPRAVKGMAEDIRLDCSMAFVEKYSEAWQLIRGRGRDATRDEG